MALTQGSALPDVKTTTQQTTTAPGYYTSYLSDVAKAGSNALATDPTKMVAGFSDLTKSGISDVTPAADSYQTGIANATNTANTVAGGLNANNINNLMNPYTAGVVDEMGRLQQKNINSTIIPGLKGAFASTGGSGSSRFANATGQTLADMQANLTGQQTGALQKGYSEALGAALQNLSLQNQAAQTQGTLAGQEQKLGLTGAEAKINAGNLEQNLEQAKIDAPLKTAMNASSLMKGYTVPTSTVQNYTGPMPGAYAPSTLQQIAGLATLFASGAGGTSPIKGVTDWIKANIPGSTVTNGNLVTGADGTKYTVSEKGELIPAGSNESAIEGGMSAGDYLASTAAPPGEASYTPSIVPGSNIASNTTDDELQGP
jgi:hypothetical protein